ncbi:phosphodiesterase [Bacillus toyonensis]|uniref:phosphodiesterase n=1 Tax=Bacillus toyonensis TaxID=155322 RepID=UPI000BEB3834|nr:phosphodiesterase [Bacillus toyonensis]PDZ33744.1 phosphodiesterase [Bacillus toyonensis]PEI55357.1 phosphodiesterase [Bacillus toyonensis]PEJ12830.1 phosphodiesterase [Bacillus toyonensis]PGE75317.1 phosphodiesterase [Bacillus toyonensis]PHC13787.1 phosphodiesterase [Bacillus toyonensis]
MEIKEKYELHERYKTCIYCDSDEFGNITQVEHGQRIIPGQNYMHFFKVDRYIADTIQNYKVVWNERVAELQAVDLEINEKVKRVYFAPTKEELEREKAEMEAKLKLLEEQLAAQKVAPNE